MQTITLTHQGQPVALAAPTRVWLAAHTQELPVGDPRRRPVAFIAFYARDARAATATAAALRPVPVPHPARPVTAPSSQNMMTLKRQPEAGTAQLVAALEDAWRAIASNHADLPPAAIILGQGSGRRGGALVLGHFAAERWQRAGARQGSYVHEVLIGGEGLQRGAADVLATLLHEAAHAIATVREIADTSRQGRYHNARFKALAEELGLSVARHPAIGWSLTTLPAPTASRYESTIATLQRAITLHRRAEPGPRAAGGTNLTPAACACPRRIRVAPGTLAAGPILCTICSQHFAPVDGP
jgi:hypothetical protein